MADLTNGFDFADGKDGRLGTTSPVDSILVQSAGGTGIANQPIEQEPDTPEIERAEQATIQHRFTMSWNEAKNRIQYMGRGTLLQDSYLNVTKVLSSKIQRHRGGTASMSVTAESVSFDSPPDEFSIVPVELGVNIIKHPRYFYAFMGNRLMPNTLAAGDLAGGQGSLTEQLNQQVIRFLQMYFENTSAPLRNAIAWLMENSKGSEGSVGDQDPVPTLDEATGRYDWDLDMSGTDMAKAAALEIIQKYWRGEETPYLVGYQINWSAYYFRPPYINPGGYVENPMTNAAPQLPDYFWAVDYPVSSYTVFDAMGVFNPQCYSQNGSWNGPVVWSWLRKADEVEYQRTWFKVNRQWIGSPVGFWDLELYNASFRPQRVADYVPMNVEV